MTINSFTHQFKADGLNVVFGKDTYDLQDIQNCKPMHSRENPRFFARRQVRGIQRRQESDIIGKICGSKWGSNKIIS